MKSVESMKNYLFKKISPMLEKINLIIEDNQRFSNYFKKTYPNVYFFLPIVKLLTWCSLFISTAQDFNLFREYISYKSCEGSELVVTSNSWTLHILYFYLCIIGFELIMSVTVILYANHPIRNTAFQVVKHALKAGVGGISCGYVVAYSPLEPNPVSNFVHTKLPGGRGYDFEQGDIISKLKGHTLASHLGKEKMAEAVAEHGPSSKILKREHITWVVTDPKYRDIICKDAGIAERAFMGVPILNDVGGSSTNESSQESYSENHGKENSDEETKFGGSSNFQDFETDPLKNVSEEPNVNIKKFQTDPLTKGLKKTNLKMRKSAPPRI